MKSEPAPLVSAWSRLGLALRDVAVETYGAAKAFVVRAWDALERLVDRIVSQTVATAVVTYRQVRSAVAQKLGKRGRTGFDTEAASGDTADRQRARKWTSFSKGKTSAAYLQDDGSVTSARDTGPKR